MRVCWRRWGGLCLPVFLSSIPVLFPLLHILWALLIQTLISFSSWTFWYFCDNFFPSVFCITSFWNSCSANVKLPTLNISFLLSIFYCCVFYCFYCFVFVFLLFCFWSKFLMSYFPYPYPYFFVKNFSLKNF